MTLGQAAQFEEDVQTIAESLEMIEEKGERVFEAEVHRLKGELLLAQNPLNAAPAEESFRAAIDISRRARATASRHQPPRGSAHPARRHLQLVHRGIRHRRPEGRQGTAIRTQNIACHVFDSG